MPFTRIAVAADLPSIAEFDEWRIVSLQTIASALLAHLESICNRDRIWISTNADNLPMQGLLQKRGYERSGIIENLDPIPELVYSKRIAR
ncbi:MAG: hypothetical protein WCD79_21250 [Chthoniobacteraceae bacterium]